MSSTEHMPPDVGLSGWVSGAGGRGTHLQDLLAKREKGELVSLDLLFAQAQVFDVDGQLGVRMSDGTSTVALINGAGVEGPKERDAAIRNAETIAGILESYVSIMKVRRGDRKPFKPVEPDDPVLRHPPVNHLPGF